MCGKNRFRNLALLSAGTLAGTLAGTEAASAEGRNGSEAPKKPNILFFLVDDLGWSDIYEGENETYIEASAENSGSTLYDKEIRDKPRTRHTKRNV